MESVSLQDPQQGLQAYMQGSPVLIPGTVLLSSFVQETCNSTDRPATSTKSFGRGVAHPTLSRHLSGKKM